MENHLITKKHTMFIPFTKRRNTYSQQHSLMTFNLT